VSTKLASAAHRAALAFAVALLVAAPVAADVAPWSHLDGAASARLASAPSSWIDESNVKRTSDLGGKSWWRYDSSWNPNVYVQNNPVNATDPDGEFAWFGAAIGAAIDLGFQVAVEGKSLSDVNWVSVGVSAASGATGVGLGNVVAKTFAKSALTRVAANAVGSAAIGAASNVIDTVGTNLVEGSGLTENLTLKNVASAAALSGIAGGIGSALDEGARTLGRIRADALYHSDLADESIPFYSVWRRSDRVKSLYTGVGNSIGTTLSNSGSFVGSADVTSLQYSGTSDDQR